MKIKGRSGIFIWVTASALLAGDGAYDYRLFRNHDDGSGDGIGDVPEKGDKSGGICVCIRKAH